jgi:hypothetical protein
MTKILIRMIVSCFVLITPSLAQAQVGAVSGDLGTACSATAPTMTANGACTFTPTTYKIQTYEMGLCKAHPFGVARTGVTFDASSCSKIYEDAAPTQVDIAASLGGSAVPLAGTSTPAPEGTFTHAYMVMDDTFVVSGSFTSNGATHVSLASGASGTIGGGDAVAEATNNLTNFGDSPNCDSGFHDAVVTGGTMDAYVTNSTLTRSARAGQASGNPSVCVNSGRLIGVMKLNTPVVVTPQTISVIFTFDLTNQGVQFFDDAGADAVPDAFGSGPFSGFFTVVNE